MHKTPQELVADLIAALKDAKPNDRSEMDRQCAICITEAENLEAIIKYRLGG